MKKEIMLKSTIIGSFTHTQVSKIFIYKNRRRILLAYGGASRSETRNSTQVI